MLAGQNGGGKSSVLELLALALTTRYSYQYFQARQMTGHAFSMKIGLSDVEISELVAETIDPTVVAFLKENRGYWSQMNSPGALSGRDVGANERVHTLVSNKFRSFSRKLGFFIRSDRGYIARSYTQTSLFTYRNREQPSHLATMSYRATHEQFADMYDFLVEQSYHYIYDLGVHHKNQIEGKASTSPSNPLKPYNELLSRLFPGYYFVETSSTNLVLQVRLPSGDIIPFQDLSSGEKEVFFILAFFIRHNISNSIIVVDEPELHLHPELSRKFVRLMRSTMPGNQIWIATHSADLVDEAGRERAFFVRRKLDDPTLAEAIPATSDENELQLLRDLFGYSGFIGVSRKLVFTEGTNSGADRKTFSNLFPNLADEIKIIPSGSSSNLQRINRAILALLGSNVARCEFYLIRDRDYMSDQAVANESVAAPGRLFVLQRHEIENYLLDEEIIQVILEKIFQKHLSTLQIRDDFLAIAKQQSGSYLRDMVVARYSELFQGEDCSVGRHSSGVSIIDASGGPEASALSGLKSALLEKMATITADISGRVTQSNLDQVFEESLDRVKRAIDPGRDDWKILLPGKELLQRFSREHGLGEWPALQNLIIEFMAESHREARGDLVPIFERIAGVATSGS